MDVSMRIKCFFISLAMIITTGNANAHKGIKQQGPEHETQNLLLEHQQAKFFQINEEYKKRVKTIFQKSCFDCHSQQTRYPWYYKLPGIKQKIDSDIMEGGKHLDLTHDFPFHGHGSPRKDLAAIKKVVSGGTMPPFRYKIMHIGGSGRGLTEEEKRAILEWIDLSQKMLDMKQ